MADWMGRLPPSIRQKPLSTICIPGSHDTGAYWFNMHMDYAHDQSFLRYIRRFKCGFVKRIVKRWAETQEKGAEKQLLAGVRFFDLRIELAIDGSSNSSPDGSTMDDSRKSCFIVHGLYGTDWLNMANEIVKFLASHQTEVVILNVNHMYRMTEYDFRRFFLHPLASAAGRAGLVLCPTYVDLRAISLEELVEKGFRIILVGPTEGDVDGCSFRSAAIQNRWPNKNNVVDLLTFMQAQIHAPVSPGFRVMQGVLTPTLRDIFVNWRQSLKRCYSIPCREAVKEWVRHLDKEERENLNILISDQIDVDFCRMVFSLNLVDFPDVADFFAKRPNVERRLEYSPELEHYDYETVGSYPTPPESDKKGRAFFPEIPEEDEPEFLIEEIIEDDGSCSSLVPPRKPLRTSVMIQQIEMVLEKRPSSSQETSLLTGSPSASPIPPPKPKRFSQRIPIFMEVEPIPDYAILIPLPDVPTGPISRSTGTPVRIALPVTEEELRLAALGEYPPFGSQRWYEEQQEKKEEEKKTEEKTDEEEEEEKSSEDNESTPLISESLDHMVEDLVIHSTLDAMNNLADRFKDDSAN
ncbi:unnamed protein product [Caenorhabditis sp. 36 PRJEB53466]|nr:unnamed protein product [Caenorhabditis sp. 36 PRJEB53466]